MLTVPDHSDLVQGELLEARGARSCNDYVLDGLGLDLPWCRSYLRRFHEWWEGL